MGRPKGKARKRKELQKGTCPACRRKYLIYPDGTMRPHFKPGRGYATSPSGGKFVSDYDDKPLYECAGSYGLCEEYEIGVD